ncbi:TadE/TadG family type IV pilus assembly protein [Primorskyibacter sp. 2E233]|uniref:TadE/TadG family type IV pilus assembly protein n=1 Tax=Primorskyibacter sp. 2E233 TaxID=3413431 RepID=UPI003BEF802E
MKLVGEPNPRFLGEEDGNMTIFSVFMVVLIIMITGASVDIMRNESVRTKMQATLDRAVLAAADLDQLQEPTGVVLDYVAKAGLTDHLTYLDVQTAPNSRTVTAASAADLDTIFLHMSGFDSLRAGALSAADERITNVEISMVLDISGSMRWNDRMTRLKPAAKDFVDKVMNDGTHGVTTLNLIPFAGQVNPGDIMFDYFRGERPKIKQNNGWGNGDQDAPGGSLCNNNAENADEGAADPSCSSGETAPYVLPTADGFFDPWADAISNIVIYFDTDGDDIYDRAHKIEGFPADAPRDADDFFRGAVAYAVAADTEITDPAQFLGISIRGGHEKNRYFQVKGDQNGPASDLGPTKNTGNIPGATFQYSSIDYAHWEQSYVSPNLALYDSAAPAPEEVNVNMPGSCIEIYDDEFNTSAMPLSSDYVPHFNYWPYEASVMDWGWCPGEDTAVQYYSSDAEQLKTFIEDMRMHDGTGAQYGMKYALSLLNPDTREAVSHMIAEGLVAPQFEGRPINWQDPETEKYIVMMTDGNVTEQYRPLDPKAAINGEVALQTQGSGTYEKISNASHNVENLHKQCDLAKELGVTVFTIAFETSESAAAEMRSCASSESHFFHVQGEEIAEAFDTIARQINNLRLIQ